MINIQKTLELSQLYQIYKNTLTSKQKEYFELYYYEDFSFQEIADELMVSKNAVFDSLKKTSKILLDLEENLKFFHFKNEVKKALNGDENALLKLKEEL